MDIQDVEFAKSSGEMIAKLSRIVLEQASEIARITKNNTDLIATLEKGVRSDE